MSKQEYWQQQRQQYQEQIQPWEHQSRVLSTWRIIMAGAALISAIAADQSRHMVIYGFTVFCLSIFVWLVFRHRRITLQLAILRAKLRVTQKLCDRCDDTWQKELPFKNDQPKPKSMLGEDLDLLGEQSLFQYLYFGATNEGHDRLVSLLLNQERNNDKLVQRQKAIQELLDQSDWWMEFAGCVQRFAHDHPHRNDQPQSLEADPAPCFPQWFVCTSFTLSLLIILCLILGFLHLLPYGYAAVLILVQLLVGLVIRHRCSKALSSAVDYVTLLKDYRPLFACMKQASFHHETLLQLRKTAITGEKGIIELRRVMDMLALRQNLFAVWIVGALFPIDVACVLSFERWQEKYGSEVKQWLKAVGEMEALISLSVLAKVKEHWCFPELCEAETVVLEVQDGVHPLIHEAKAVGNSLCLQGGTYLLTGSNMSGKTTFLRTLGTLSVLGRAGAPACAAKMRISPLQVFTSIRIRDDVNAGISHFYAELLRLKMIVDQAAQKQPLLVLIDEIFTGTNSADRIVCAEAIIRKLHLPWVISVVTTHDFELCRLADDERISAHNYHFGESYQNAKIHFDYRLREGRCTTTNAVELLRLVGIDTTQAKSA